jgi:hypothetical protein
LEARTVDELYEIARQLPVKDRLELVERIAHDLLTTIAPLGERYSWLDIAGIAPDLLGGEDAQEWVSRSRREADRRTGDP